jgi:hypothetical protein
VYRRIALLHLHDPDRDAERLERALATTGEHMPELRYAHLGRHLPNTVGGGHFTWDLAFADRDSCPSWAEQLARAGHDSLFREIVARADVVQFASSNVHLVEPDLTDCVKRTLFLEVDRTTAPERAAEFDRVLTGMPRYISTIRNWAYHRVDDDATLGPRRWTHVWEQEYHDISGLRGEYMMNPYHWGYVDPWFDPESPTRVVRPGVAHVFCPARASVLRPASGR